MTDINLNFELLKSTQDIPYDLLALADPSSIHVESYLKTGTCYIAKFESKIIGVVVLNMVDSSTIEIKNLAVREFEQGKGYGKALLKFSEQVCRDSGYKKIIIGTGNSSIGQLALYQKAEFEMIGIKRNFFLENYTEHIFENGIQCKHLIILEKSI